MARGKAVGAPPGDFVSKITDELVASRNRPLDVYAVIFIGAIVVKICDRAVATQPAQRQTQDPYSPSLRL